MLRKLMLIAPVIMLAWSACGAIDDFKKNYATARQKMQSGNYPEAISELKKAMSSAQLSSEEVSVLFDLAFVHLKLSKMEESIEYLHRVLEIPDITVSDRNRAYLQMADIHIADKKYDDAVDDCNTGIGMAESDAEKFRFLFKTAGIMSMKKDYVAALEYALQAQTLCAPGSPNYLSVKKQLVFIYSAQENYPEVVDVYTQEELDSMLPDIRKAVNPLIVNACMKVAQRMETEKMYDKAIELYKRLEKDKNIKPEQCAEAYMGEANILKAQKKYSEARHNYNAVLGLLSAKHQLRKSAQKEMDQIKTILEKQPDSK
ncbi:MAG: tetratricopeptide repeat protein [Victivallaceae bacterium]